MTVPLLRPARLFHAFFSADHVLASGGRTPARAAVEALWLRASSPGDEEKSDTLRLDRNGAPGFTVLGTCEQTLPRGFRQALVYRLHDVLGFTAMEAPNDDSLSWSTLGEPWQSDLGEMPEGVLGSAQMHLGVVGADGRHRSLDTDGDAADELGRRLGALLPGAGEAWSRSWVRPVEGVLLWELPPAAPGVPADRLHLARGFLAVAREADEETLDRWIWSPDLPVLAPFTSYLLHAAKVRYQQAVLSSALPALRGAVKRIDGRCEALAGLLAERSASTGDLVEADRAVSRLQTDQNGLIKQLSLVRDMAVSVQAARKNMADALGDRPAGPPGGPLDRDEEAARWTLEQLRIEETYLASAQAKASEATRVTGLVVSTRLQQLRENLVLLQASLLGALVTVLTAVQGLEYDVPLPGRAEAPLIALLGAVALLLPSAAVRWPRGGPGGVDRWTWFDHVLTGLAGGTAGWLALSAASLAWAPKGAPPVQSASAAVLGAFLAIGLGRLFFRRSRRLSADQNG